MEVLLLTSIIILLGYKGRNKGNSVDKCESWIERRLVSCLCREGYKVETQQWFGHKHRVDILLPDHRIVIECDGKAYHSTPEQKKRDRRKDAYLRYRGYSVMRFTGSDINGNIGLVLQKIRRKVATR